MNDNLLRLREEIRKYVFNAKNVLNRIEFIEWNDMFAGQSPEDILTVIIEVYDDFILALRNECKSIQETITYCKSDGIIHVKDVIYLIGDYLKEDLSNFINLEKSYLDTSTQLLHSYFNQWYFNPTLHYYRILYKDMDLEYRDLKGMVDQVYRYRMSEIIDFTLKLQ